MEISLKPRRYQGRVLPAVNASRYIVPAALQCELVFRTLLKTVGNFPLREDEYDPFTYSI